MRTYTLRLAATAVALAAMPAFADPHRPAGDSQVVAAVASPGYPEGIAVRGDKFYVSGPASFGLNVAPYVNEYNLNTGAFTKQFPITIFNQFAGMRAASCIAFDKHGKLYAIEPFVGIVKMNLDAANTQSVYATFPPSANSLLNDLAFDEDNNLYVTDTFAGIIYRVPAGGGTAQVWFQDARLLGNPGFPFGVNGIRVDKHGKRIYFTVTVRGDFSGAVYSLPLVKAPTAAQLTEVHVYPSTQNSPLPGPDGIAFANNGKLYVSLAGSSEISVLLPNGQEQRTLIGPAKMMGSSAIKPWANPANIAFDDEHDRILVTNHASLVPFDPSLFLVFDVAVNDKGLDLP